MTETVQGTLPFAFVHRVIVTVELALHYLTSSIVTEVKSKARREGSTRLLGYANRMDTLQRHQAKVIPALFIIFISYYIFKIFYSLYLSPARNIPGPILNKLSSYPHTNQQLRHSRRSKYIHSLHQQYGTFCIPFTLRPYNLRSVIRTGPVVRVGPNFVSVNDFESIDTIYGGKLPKSPSAYRGAHINGLKHCLVMFTPEQFKPRRKILLPLFQRQNLKETEIDMRNFVACLMKQIQREQEMRGCANIFNLFRLIAFDIICKAFPTLYFIKDLITNSYQI